MYESDKRHLSERKCEKFSVSVGDRERTFLIKIRYCTTHVSFDSRIGRSGLAHGKTRYSEIRKESDGGDLMSEEA